MTTTFMNKRYEKVIDYMFFEKIATVPRIKHWLQRAKSTAGRTITALLSKQLIYLQDKDSNIKQYILTTAGKDLAKERFNAIKLTMHISNQSENSELFASFQDYYQHLSFVESVEQAGLFLQSVFFSEKRSCTMCYYLCEHNNQWCSYLEQNVSQKLEFASKCSMFLFKNLPGTLYNSENSEHRISKLLNSIAFLGYDKKVNIRGDYIFGSLNKCSVKIYGAFIGEYQETDLIYLFKKGYNGQIKAGKQVRYLSCKVYNNYVHKTD